MTYEKNQNTGERDCDTWKSKLITEWHKTWQTFFKDNGYGEL